MKLYPNVNIIISIWVLSVLSVFYFSFSTLPHSSLFQNNFIKSLANWDGGHYLSIAEKGYLLKSQYVFFPLYPILINLFVKITGDYLVSALIISFISFFLAANIFYQLVYIDFGKSVAKKALVALLVFPLSFHFLTVYTESLFFLLSVLTFLFARKNNYFLAAIFAFLSSATRLSGLAVVLSLMASVYFSQKVNYKNWYVYLSPIGFLLYCLYLYHQTGDFFYFIKAESYFWNSGLVFPGGAIIHSFKQLFTPGFITNNFRDLLDLLFLIFAGFSVWKVCKKLSLDYAIFTLISILLPLFSPTIVAVPRYILLIFPVFIVVSLVKNEYLSLGYQIISLMLFSIYASLFINGYWVS